MADASDDVNPRLAGAAIFTAIAVSSLGIAGVWAIAESGWSRTWVSLALLASVGLGIVMGLALNKYIKRRGGAVSSRSTASLAGYSMLGTALIGSSFLSFAVLGLTLGILSVAVAVNAVALYRTEAQQRHQ